MNILKKTFLLLFLVFISATFASGVHAASLGFDKTTATVANGSTFQISVTVEPGSDSMNSTDVYVIYDPTLLKATLVSAGGLFPIVSNDISTAGKVYIAGMVSNAASSVSSAGTLATITFQGLKEGNGSLSFDCNASTIVKDDVNVSNILVCSQNGTAAITVGSGSGTAPTAAPPNGGNNPSPEELPQSGIFDNVVKFAVPGAILLILGSALRLVL